MILDIDFEEVIFLSVLFPIKGSILKKIGGGGPRLLRSCMMRSFILYLELSHMIYQIEPRMSKKLKKLDNLRMNRMRLG